MKLKELIEENKPWKTYCLVNTKNIPSLKDENTHCLFIDDENLGSIGYTPEELHPKLLEAEPMKTYMLDDEEFCFIFFDSDFAGYIEDGKKALVALFGNEILQKDIEAIPSKPFC